MRIVWDSHLVNAGAVLYAIRATLADEVHRRAAGNMAGRCCAIQIVLLPRSCSHNLVTRQVVRQPCPTPATQEEKSASRACGQI